MVFFKIFLYRRKYIQQPCIFVPVTRKDGTKANQTEAERGTARRIRSDNRSDSQTRTPDNGSDSPTTQIRQQQPNTDDQTRPEADTIDPSHRAKPEEDSAKGTRDETARRYSPPHTRKKKRGT